MDWEIGFKFDPIQFRDQDVDAWGPASGLSSVIQPQTLPEIEGSAAIGFSPGREDSKIHSYQLGLATNFVLDRFPLLHGAKAKYLFSVGPTTQWEPPSNEREEEYFRNWVGPKTGFQLVSSTTDGIGTVGLVLSANHLFDTDNGDFREQIDLGVVFRW